MVTSSEDFTEKIIMETQIELEPVVIVRNWVINKIEMLHEADQHKNAKALTAEFEEWINIPEGTDELHYICIEEEGWSNENEIDAKSSNN